MQDVIDFNLLKEYDTALKEVLEIWTKQKAYSLGDKVKYKGHLLECTTAGTSGTTTLNFTGLDIGDTITDGTVVWELVEEESGKGIDFYTVGEIYNVNDIVIYNGNIYQCITAHTATSTFDVTKWTEISASGGIDLPEWQPNTLYTAGKYLVHGGTVYKVVNDFTSGTTFSDTDLTAYIAPIMEGATSSTDGKSGMVIKPTTTDVDKFLKGDGTWGNVGGGISIWQVNTDYEVNDVVIDSNLIWKCAIAHTSTTTFDESKWICISGGEISNGLEIVTLWEGSYLFTNSTEYTAPTSSTPLIELSEPVTNYDYVIIEYGINEASDYDSVVVSSKDVTYTTTYARLNIFMNSTAYSTCALWLLDNTKMFIYQHLYAGLTSGCIYRVSGIRKAQPIVSSGMKYETLWEGEAGDYSSSFNITIPTSEPITKYKKLGLNIHYDNDNNMYYRELDVNALVNNINSGSGAYTMNNGYGNSNDYVDILSSSSIYQLVINGNKSKITKIIGISEGVQIPTGVQAARVTLWEGSIGTPTSSPVQLTDAITNYDQFEVHVTSTGVQEYSTQIFDVSDLTLGELYNYRASVHNGTPQYLYAVCIGFTDSNYFNISQLDHVGWPNAYITKIVGIKYIQPDSYSTEEKLIGTWIDGKPLYRKVFENPTDGMNTGLTSNVNIIKCYGACYNNYGDFLPVPYADTSYFISCRIALGGTLGIFSSSGVVISSFKYIAIEYTKN